MNSTFKLKLAGYTVEYVDLQKELAQECDAALARGRKEAAQCQEQP